MQDVAGGPYLRYILLFAGQIQITGKNEKETEHVKDGAHPKYKEIDPQGSRNRSAEGENLLSARLRRGNHEAAAELVDMYYIQIYSFMRAAGHNRQISEDLTQETFLKAWSHIGQLRDGRALGGWLYRIASNVSKLYWRKHKNRKYANIEQMANEEAGSEKTSYYEELTKLQKAVAQLPWKLREAIVLHYMQHLTIREAAEAANVREGTFKSRLNRALKILRKQIS